MIEITHPIEHLQVTLKNIEDRLTAMNPKSTEAQKLQKRAKQIRKLLTDCVRLK